MEVHVYFIIVCGWGVNPFWNVGGQSASKVFAGSTLPKKMLYLMGIG